MFERSALTRIRMLAVTAGCAAALSLAACGDDEESSDSGATGASGTDIEQIREEFTAGAVDAAAEQGATNAQVECLREEINDQVTDEMLLEANETGEMSAEVQEIAVDAGLACR
jgi:hypothetical protein